jgi:lysophospholipase L1-like esterase
VSRGLVALGDSITRGRGGSPALGVHPQSWALWLAEALELPFTNLAADGADAGAVLREQVPRLRGPYDLATVYVGVNDTRSLAWDAGAYERDVAAILGAVRDAAERVLVLGIPEDLGRPTAAPKPREANAILARLTRPGELLDLAGFGGRRFVLPDAVHPTSAGMVELARRAAAHLGAPRPDVEVPRNDLRYELWWLRLWVKDVVRRRRERRGV